MVVESTGGLQMMKNNIMNNNPDPDLLHVKMPTVKLRNRLGRFVGWSKDVDFVDNVKQLPVKHTKELVDILLSKIIGDYRMGKRRKLSELVIESLYTTIVVLDWRRYIGFNRVVKLAEEHIRNRRQTRSLVICANNFADPAYSIGNIPAYSFLSVYDLDDIKLIKSIEI